MSTPSAPPERDVIATTSPWPALVSLVIGFFMILVDTTIVPVAMPHIAEGLGTDLAGVLWVTSGYLLSYAVPLLIFGRLGDRLGPKWLYLAGLAIFTLASLWCGLAGSIAGLIAARVVQGLGAAMMTPQTMAIITRVFPPERRGAAMGLWGGVAGLAVLVGPIAGGLLVDTLGWEWIFWVNVPIGVIAFVAALVLVPSLPTHSHRFDWLGVVLSGVGMVLLVFGIQEGQTHDWGTVGGVSIWLIIAAGVVVLAAFAVWQKVMRGEPLMPPSLFADRNFTLANIAIAMMGVVVTAMSIPMMLFAQSVRGLDPTRAALLTLPMAVISGIMAPLVGRQLHRVNPRTFAIIGFTLLTLGLVGYFLLMRDGVSILWLLIPSSVVGVANGCIWGPVGLSATRNLAPRQAGAGAGVYNATRQIGAVLGSAAIAALMQARIAAALGSAPASGGPEGGGLGRVPPFLAAGFTRAMAESLLLPAACALVALVVVSFLATPQHLRAER